MAKKGKIEVAKDTVVSIHYTVKDKAGKKLETSIGEEPMIYLHGHKQIIPGLEKALSGKTVGEKFNISVAAKDGYGAYNDSLKSVLKKDQFADKREVKVGSIFQFSDPEGNPVVVRVTQVKGNDVTVDGNHPFAGQDLSFAVEVVGIREATKEEIAHGHAHHGDGHHHH